MITPDLEIVNRKRELVVSWSTEWKSKKTKKRDEYLELAKEQKKLWNMIVIAIVIGVLERGQEDLEIGEWIQTIQTIALLKSASILKRVPKTYNLHSCEKPSANAGVKNS